MHPSQRLQELFERYLEKKCQPEEVAELIALLRHEDADEALEPRMQALWEDLKKRDTSYVVDWDSMYQRIGRAEEDLYRLGHRRRMRPMRYWAAALIVLLAGGGLWWASRGKSKTDVPDIRTGGDLVVSKANGSGEHERRIVHLPDGSTVRLNTNSRLDYPPVFASDRREVVLSGEGYFEIRSQSGKPFIVRSGKLTTKVLGTAFNIKAYPADSAVAITVTKGKIQVMRDGRSMGILTAHQQLNFDNLSEQSCKQEKVDVQPVIAWVPSEIGFDDLTMEEVSQRLEKRFNVRIVFEQNAVRDMHVTATFSEDDGLEEMLSVICGVVKSSYRMHDNQITIYGPK